MKQIWKFKLDGVREQTISMPFNAKVLCVKSQFGGPVIWALVTTNAPKTGRTFMVYGTGHDIDESCELIYIGTFQMSEGALIFHVFERIYKHDNNDTQKEDN